MTTKPRGSMLLDIAGIIGSRGMLVVFGLGTGILTARILGPHDRGLFTLLLLLPQTLVAFTKMGVAQANVYQIRKREIPIETVASNAFVLCLVLSAAMLLVCFAGGQSILAPFTKGAPPSFVWLVLLLIPFILIESYFLSILQAVEEFRAYTLQSVYKAILGFGGVASALLLFHGGLWEALLSQVLVLSAVNLWLLYRVRRVAPFGLHWTADVGRSTLTFGLKSYLQTLASHLHYRIGLYLVAYYLNPAEVAFYSIAINVTNPILHIPDAVGTVIFPKLAGSSAADAHQRTSVTCRHTVFATMMASVLYVGLGSQLLPFFYGERYTPAITPMFMMLPGIIMISMYQILTRNFTSRNRQQVNIFAASIALAINCLLNVLLIPRFGIAGAAASTAVSYTIASTILLVAFVRESGASVRQTVMVGGADLAMYPRMLMAAGARLRGSS